MSVTDADKQHQQIRILARQVQRLYYIDQECQHYYGQGIPYSFHINISDIQLESRLEPECFASSNNEQDYPLLWTKKPETLLNALKIFREGARQLLENEVQDDSAMNCAMVQSNEETIHSSPRWEEEREISQRPVYESRGFDLFGDGYNVFP